MNIAFIADSLPPSTDGVSKTYSNLVATLLEEKVKFCFLSPFKPGKDVGWTDNVKQVHYIPFPLYPDYRLGLPVMQKLPEKLDEFQPDIIHASSPTFMGQMAVNYARRRHIPAVAVYHTDFVSYFKYYGFGRVEKFGWSFLRWFYNQFSKTLAPSQSVARLLDSKDFTNIDLWQRGIDIDRFSPTFRDQDLRKKYAPNGESLLLFVGRLVKEKDLSDIVLLNQILKNKDMDFRFVIVGDGPLREELGKKLADGVFTGYLHGNDLSKIYASCDIFVFPSTTETFGNVILEAHASGLPVITVDKGGVTDLVVDGEDGYVCMANHPEQMAEKISLLLTDNEKKQNFSHTGRKNAANYSWDTINHNLLNLYSELIDSFRKEEG